MTAARGREVDPERVEKVARAIWDVDQDPDEAWSVEWEDDAETVREDYRVRARAALAADTGEAQQAVEDVVVPAMPKSRRVLGRFRLDGAE